MLPSLSLEPHDACWALPDGEIHLSLTPLALAQGRSSLVDRYIALLSPAERAQQLRFHFERDRHRYLGTRALVRTMLSQYVGIPPKDLAFKNNAYGRPMLADLAQAAQEITFNIAHSSDLVVCAVRRRQALGVDTENLRRNVSLGSANRYFAEIEVNELRSLPECEQPARFLELWTLKESYIKARSMGLSIPLNDFGFSYPAGRFLRPFFHNNDTPQNWKFWQLRFNAHDLISVCTRNVETPRLVAHEVTPLQTRINVELEVLRESA
jgi:4'-phosphopantetheinyl transferase